MEYAFLHKSQYRFYLKVNNIGDDSFDYDIHTEGDEAEKNMSHDKDAK